MSAPEIPEPFYLPDHTSAAYQLRFNWTGWPSVAPLPPTPEDAVFTELADRWEDDDIRLLDRHWSPNSVHLFTSVKPTVSPVFFATRMKGRLQHALRKNETPVKFSRKLAMSCIGDTKLQLVEDYVENQVVNEHFADPRFAEFLERFTVVDETINLAKPTRTDSGRYWYNLHLVLVVRGRFRVSDEPTLKKLRDGALRIAELKGHQISRLSVMPDHLHATLRGNIEHSPEEIALSYMNNLAFLLKEAFWQPSYYVGGFGEYDMGVLRLASQAHSPAGRARRGL